MSKDLHLSAKFAAFLQERGMLLPVVNTYKQYRDQQNYPFVLKDKRIATLSIYSSLCDKVKDPKISAMAIMKKAKKLTEELFNEKPKTMGEEITKKYGKPSTNNLPPMRVKNKTRSSRSK